MPAEAVRDLRQPASPITGGGARLPDADAILAPLAGERPAGVSVRYEGDYDRIQEARREDNPNLPQGIWQHDLKQADWDEVVDLCVDTLSHRSKDLQVAAWLAEALVRRDGFAGLAPGLNLMAELCRRFWPHLFPEFDGDDPSPRLAPVQWINDKLPASLFRLPITRAGAITVESHSWTDYLNAQRHEVTRLRDAKSAEKAEKRGLVTLAQFNAAVAATSSDVFKDRLRHLEDGRRALDELDQALQEQCGRDGPGLGRLRDAVDDIGGFIRTVLTERGELMGQLEQATPRDEAERERPDLEADSASGPAVSTPSAAGPICSREEAYRRLAEVADYLARSEPHSPTPYLIRRAIAWGNLPLPALILEMTHGGKDVSALFEILGLSDRK
ncbi:MAG: type VI secretion system protein TssA [Rhodospirillales bacterium]|nr:MAG: type VI secretion system protein TssA [Rhodospirillales bacterium]